MNKKILFFGSILAIVILILASFNSVVGFQDRKVSSAKTSPLFFVRAKRATSDNTLGSLTCEYVGKGKASMMPFPVLGGYRSETFNEFIDYIKKLDDKAFKEFLNVFVNYYHNTPRLKNIDDDTLKAALYKLRSEPYVFKNNVLIPEDKETPPLYTKAPVSELNCCTAMVDPDCHTIGGNPDLTCVIGLFLLIIILAIAAVIMEIMCLIFGDVETSY